MIPELIQVEQGSPEWLEARLGLATASRFKDILTTIKTGESAARRNYKAELVVERLTGQLGDRYSNKYMEYGTETEPLARLEYILKSGNSVDEAGFFQHPSLEAGASPDGLVSQDGLIEIKCRQIANHLQMLHVNEVSPEYIPQIQGQLWITGRKWCDFVSFVPELPENAQLFTKRVLRDEAYITKLAQEVEQFLQEVAAEVAFVKGYQQ